MKPSLLTVIAITLSMLTTTPLMSQEFGPGFVFEIKKDQKIVGYLIGSFHLLKESDHPLPATISKAFERSGKIYFETDLEAQKNPGFQQKILEEGRLRDGQKLSDILSPEVYAELTGHLDKAGLPDTAIANFQPWLAAMMTVFLELQNAGYEIQSGVESHILDKALAASKQIGQLETPETQIDALKVLAQEDPDAAVRDLLNTLPEAPDLIIGMVQAWKKGDPAPIAALLIEQMPEDSLYNKVLLRDRNKAWIPIMQEAMTSETTPPLFVVGAAHLIGTDNVRDLLTQVGYEITPLK